RRPPMTSVWPALRPPWNRTTPATDSVSQSTILPLPSSPHCVPMITTFFAIPFTSTSTNDPATVLPDELAVAGELLRLVLVSGKGLQDHLPSCAQGGDRLAKFGVVPPGRPDRGRSGRRGRELRQRAQLQGEAGRR